MRFRLPVMIAGLVLSVCLPVAAHADPVLYTFTGTGLAAGTNFTYLSTSGFLSFGSNTLTPTTAGDLLGYGGDYGPIRSFSFDSSTVAGVYAHGYLPFFVTTYSLDTYGLQNASPAFQNALSFTLDIEPFTATTPEPSSIALLGTGFLAIVGATRRRFIP